MIFEQVKDWFYYYIWGYPRGKLEYADLDDWLFKQNFIGAFLKSCDYPYNPHISIPKSKVRFLGLKEGIEWELWMSRPLGRFSYFVYLQAIPRGVLPDSSPVKNSIDVFSLWFHEMPLAKNPETEDEWYENTLNHYKQWLEMGREYANL